MEMLLVFYITVSLAILMGKVQSLLDFFERPSARIIAQRKELCLALFLIHLTLEFYITH